MRLASVASRRTAAAVLVGIAVTSPAWVSAFQDPAGAPREQEVQIAREAIQIRSPNRYEQHVSLAPVQSLEVPAPAEGYVRTLNVKAGAKSGKESELLRLDDTRASLVLKAAQARLQAAQLEKKLARDSDQQALADARIEAAKSEVELAQWDVDRLVIRAPFAGEVHAIHVVEGQFVRAGQPLLTLADVSQLRAEVPVDSGEVKTGGELELRINENLVAGKVEVLLPPIPRFEPLRDLTDRLQTAIVVFENSTGKLSAGQTAYCELIPLEPVAKVATSAVKNQTDGTRKVQVLRNNIVRDVPVSIHSKVGTEKVFVSGAFREGDELISKSSIELADGTPVRELLAQAGNAPADANPQNPTSPRPRPAPTGTGF